MQFLVIVTGLVLSSTLVDAVQNSAPKHVLVDDVKLEVNPFYMNITMTNKPSGQYVWKFNMTIQFFRDLPEVLRLHGVVKNKAGLGKYRTIYSADELEFCKFLKNPSRKPLIKIIKDNAEKYGLKLGYCPIKSGTYTLQEFQFDFDVLPSFIPLGDYLIDGGASGVVDGKTIMLYKFLWYGHIVDK